MSTIETITVLELDAFPGPTGRLRLDAPGWYGIAYLYPGDTPGEWLLALAEVEGISAPDIGTVRSLGEVSERLAGTRPWWPRHPDPDVSRRGLEALRGMPRFGEKVVVSGTLPHLGEGRRGVGVGVGVDEGQEEA